MKSMYRWLPLLVLFAALTSACGGKDDGPECGNGTCEAGEDSNSCSADCAQGCGNGTCDAGETEANCSADCAATCNNNGTCNNGENSDNCPNDCPVTCNNNGTCDAGETTTSCAADCPAACNNNGTCDAGETPTNCAADCNTTCGNGTCDVGENSTNCSTDCASTCGNGTCDAGETIAGCPADCTDVCALVTGGLNAGQECQNEAVDFCGPENAGVCASFDAAVPATCFQGCVPGQCETTCVGEERCLGVIDDNGNPIEIQPGVPQGVCDIPPTGSQTAFDQCGGASGNCEAAMDCLSFSSSQPAMCMPQCSADADCPAREGVASTCVIAVGSATSPTNCGLTCDPANPTCPAAMTCTAVTGGGLCMY